MFQVCNELQQLMERIQMNLFCVLKGQTVLYIAAYMGSLKMVELILKYRVKAKSLKTPVTNNETVSVVAENVPTKKRISDSIQALMSRLNVNLKSDSSASNSHNISPVEVYTYPICFHYLMIALIYFGILLDLQDFTILDFT